MSHRYYIVSINQATLTASVHWSMCKNKQASWIGTAWHLGLYKWIRSSFFPAITCNLFGNRPLPKSSITHCESDPRIILWQNTKMILMQNGFENVLGKISDFWARHLWVRCRRMRILPEVRIMYQISNKDNRYIHILYINIISYMDIFCFYPLNGICFLLSRISPREDTSLSNACTACKLLAISIHFFHSVYIASGPVTMIW